jgi:hypothetical protein
MIKKLNDIQVRFLKKIFITWLKKEGYYDDYINAKMYLKMNPHTITIDGWPHSFNESKIFYTYSRYSNIIDETIDYYRCNHIRSDWGRINDKWKDFALGKEALLMSTIFKK